MLLVVWVCAVVPPVWVMAVEVGVFWWCVFQYWVAVVWASSVVPGVLACSGVSLLVCVVWFRMLMCLVSFLSCLSCCLVNNGLSCVWVWVCWRRCGVAGRVGGGRVGGGVWCSRAWLGCAGWCCWVGLVWWCW